MLATVPDRRSLPLSHQGLSRPPPLPYTCDRGVIETQCSGKALNYLLQEAWPDKRVIVELLPMRSLSIKCLKKKAFIPVSALVRASCM